MDMTLHHVGVLAEDIPKAVSFYVQGLGYERNGNSSSPSNRSWNSRGDSTTFIEAR